MAAEIGISRVHLIALENGRAPFNRPVLLAWSKVTGFEVDDFILPEVSTQRRIEEEE
jgi:transcriptional regulator with XRE-family HTH domain